LDFREKKYESGFCFLTFDAIARCSAAFARCSATRWSDLSMIAALNPKFWYGISFVRESRVVLSLTIM